MKTIILVTGNSEKIKQITTWMHDLDPAIKLEHHNLSLREYQSMQVREVALSKAQDAWDMFKHPVLIDDVGLYLQKYNLFPGTMTKHVYAGIGIEGVQQLAKDDPRAYFLCCLAYMDGENSYHFFEGLDYGKIIQGVPKDIKKEAPFPAIFIPDGYQQTLDTLSGTDEEKKFHHRYKAVEKLVAWLKKR